MVAKKGEEYINSPEKRRLDILAARMLTPFELSSRALAMTQGPRGRTIILEQERVGAEGRLFRVRKLQTLEEDGVTPISTLLDTFRQNGIDELPQIGNILSGEMSLVGRRPLLPGEFDEQYDIVGHDSEGAKLVDRHRQTAGQAKPGLLSSHAIQGHRGNMSVMNLASRLELDVYDFEQASFAHTVRLIRTVLESMKRAELKHGSIRINESGIDHLDHSS